MDKMSKHLILALLSTLLLSGCSLMEANARMKREAEPIKNIEKHKKPDINQIKTITIRDSDKEETRSKMQWEKEQVFIPSATISFSPFTYQSTTTTINTLNRKVDFSEIKYQIWRIADGPNSMKTFASNNKDLNFPLLFDTKEFSSLRGDYQIEAYGIDVNDQQKLLAKTIITFQQSVPILMYHAVDKYKGEGLKGLFVDPDDFEAQMKYLKNNGYTLLTFEHWDDINKVNKPIFVTFDDGMKNNLNAFRILQKLEDDSFHPTATEYMIAGAIDSGPYWLSSGDLKEMADSGIFSIQSHTMSHADLPKITNYEEELKTSKEKIEQITGKPVIAIAYPFGHFDDKVVDETKKYYKYATTTKPGQYIEKNQENDLLLLKRVRISDTTTISQFAALVK
jgi:peptidoglycan/xylan/chitin deacetylase (PgdA/CDA1 family)